jgi:hypothetical protein
MAHKISVESSVENLDPGYGIRCLFDPWIRDPRWVKRQDSDPGSGILDEQPGLYFLELRNHFLGLKYLNSLMGVRDPGRKQFGSGIWDG